MRTLTLLCFLWSSSVYLVTSLTNSEIFWNICPCKVDSFSDEFFSSVHSGANVPWAFVPVVVFECRVNNLQMFSSIIALGPSKSIINLNIHRLDWISPLPEVFWQLFAGQKAMFHVVVQNIEPAVFLALKNSHCLLDETNKNVHSDSQHACRTWIDRQDNLHLIVANWCWNLTGHWRHWRNTGRLVC